MSQENVEVIRAAQEAWNAGDMDAFRELYDPDATIRPSEGWPEPGPYVEAVMRQFEQMRSTWTPTPLELISDLIDVGDRVVGRTSWHAVGQGPDISIEVTQVLTVRNGRIVGVEFFWNHAEALETLRLSEQDAHADS